MGRLSERFLCIAGKRGGEKSGSPGRLLKRLNTPHSHLFFFPASPSFDNKEENLKNSQCFRLTALIRDRREKINSLMSRAVSPIKVLVRQRSGTLAEPWEGDCQAEMENDRAGQWTAWNWNGMSETWHHAEEQLSFAFFSSEERHLLLEVKAGAGSEIIAIPALEHHGYRSCIASAPDVMNGPGSGVYPSWPAERKNYCRTGKEYLQLLQHSNTVSDSPMSLTRTVQCPWTQRNKSPCCCVPCWNTVLLQAW